MFTRVKGAANMLLGGTGFFIDTFSCPQREGILWLHGFGKQRTQWEKVIEIFNDRFFVPFKLSAKNKIPVMLGDEPMLNLGFIFEDGNDKAPVEKEMLLRVLSQGEKKALYVLNIIFEVEVRKLENRETILIIDDIADSFDYKNKYAIIEYLKDISEDSNFKQIILTHNFDFFRTVNSRFVRDINQCLMAAKTNTGIVLTQAQGIQNIFVKDWKKHFYTDSKKKVACIPFIRNIIEYTIGTGDPDYITLTSLLHWKVNSPSITIANLDAIYNKTFNENGNSTNGNKAVVDLIFAEARACLNAPAGINFENKIVLAIAIRLAAEQFMVAKINDPAFVNGINYNQTTQLLRRFKQDFSGDGFRQRPHCLLRERWLGCFLHGVRYARHTSIPLTPLAQTFFSMAF